MDAESRGLVSHKIKTARELAEILGPRPRAKKTIMCHGTFDLVHPGHIRHLLYAKSKADLLIASLTADTHVKKAQLRPFVPEDLRAINLAALQMVDYVLIDPNETPIENLKIVQPDFYAKGYEYTDGAVNPKTQEEIDTLTEYGGEIIFTPGDIVFSSSEIIELRPPDLSVEKIMMAMQGEGLELSDLEKALDAAAGIKVHVIGDTIVDSLTETTMIGGMTKTPTISVRFDHKTDYVGGAGIVAKHLRAAGADVTFTTVLGDDALKDFVIDDLKKANVTTNAIIDPTRPTTNKNAIIASNYRLLKVDTLDNRSISEAIVSKISKAISTIDADIVVISDFRHGIFNRDTIPAILAAIPENVVKVADSQVASRWGNILEYQGFDLLTPNEREARFALGDQDSVVRRLATELHHQAKCKSLILKLGSRGVLCFRTRPEGDPRAIVTIDSFARQIIDPVGAGDALLAYASLALRSSGNEVIATILGSMAAGLECEANGNQPVELEAMKKRVQLLKEQIDYAHHPVAR